jgi:hypothetical protein
VLEGWEDKQQVIYDTAWEEFGRSTGSTGLLECYCRDLFLTAGFSALDQEEFVVDTGTKTTTHYWCSDWLSSYIITNTWRYGSVIFVLLLNLVLRFVFKRLVAFEGPKYSTSGLVRKYRCGSPASRCLTPPRFISFCYQQFSRMLKLFIVQVLNTAFVVLVVNAQLDVKWEALRRGNYRDFTEDWFLDVGVALTITMLLNIAVPHFAAIGEALKLFCL